jgi:hypothetical protein
MGVYIITLSKTGYTFSPAQRLINIPSDATDVNFQGGLYYTVSGRITDNSGQGVPGIRIYADTDTSVATDSNGYYSLQLLEGQRTLSLGRPGWRFVTNASGIAADDTADGTAFSFSFYLSSDRLDIHFTGNDKPPIVLVRGWIGQNYDFEFVDDELKTAGYYVRYADIESTKDYTPSIFVNVDRLIAAIDEALQDTGQRKVILVAHSMGGIISRAYIEGPQYRRDVAQLFTFGTGALP